MVFRSGFSLVFFFFEDWIRGKRTTNKSTLAHLRQLNEGETPPHPDESKTNTCTGKGDGATADFTVATSRGQRNERPRRRQRRRGSHLARTQGGTQTGALISSTERAGAAQGLSQCRAWAGACPVGSHLQEFPGFKAPRARCSGLPLPRRCTRSLGSGAGPGLTSQEGGFDPFLEKKNGLPHG